MKPRYFEYHCWESEDSQDAELWHHTHQLVTVLYREKECDTPVYRIKFNDGFEASAFIDELLKNTNEYQRSDYGGLK